jgi:signal transduction histidine kinase
VTDTVARLRGQLSSLQSLLTLAQLMGDSGDRQRIVQLAGTAVPSLSRCQLVGILLAGGWGLLGPAGGPAQAMARLSRALQQPGAYGGAVALDGAGWAWAYPMRSAAGHLGFLVVAAAAEPSAEERFVLQALAQQAAVALANVQLRAEEHAAATRALRAQREADQANRAKSEFLSRMSHELRTPLNAILGFSQLLQLDDLPDEQHESVEQILRAGRHLLGLIEEVLDLSRVEAGTLTLSLEAAPVAEVLQETVDLIRPLAAARQLQVRALPPQGDWRVQADRQRLRQVLLNLAANAVKYTHHGSITLACTTQQNRVRIAVHDTGPGIPAGELPRLFTPFDRLGAERTDTPGAGIGLALSKRLVEAMGGTLVADSALGQGTTVTVELPLATEPTRAAHMTVALGPAHLPEVAKELRQPGDRPPSGQAREATPV